MWGKLSAKKKREKKRCSGRDPFIASQFLPFSSPPPRLHPPPSRAIYDGLVDESRVSVRDKRNFVAGAVAAFDLRTLELKWHITLDVTTSNTRYLVRQGEYMLMR